MSCCGVRRLVCISDEPYICICMCVCECVHERRLSGYIYGTIVKALWTIQCVGRHTSTMDPTVCG